MEDGRLHHRGDRPEWGLHHADGGSRTSADPHPPVRGGRGTGADAGPVALRRPIDRGGSEDEAAWKAGRRPRVEDPRPADSTVAERAALLEELVPLEAEYRRRAGEEPTAGEYCRRFPDLDPTWLAGALAAEPTVRVLGPRSFLVNFDADLPQDPVEVG